MRRAITSLIVIGTLLMLSGVAMAQDSKPDATLKLSGGSAGAGVGFSWGSGVLTYQGKNYPFKVEGLSVGNVGITVADASGQVYHLKNLQDFSGIYTSVSAGATLAGGGSVTAMRNQNGVEITLTSTTQGLNVKLAAEGMKISLRKQSELAER